MPVDPRAAHVELRCHDMSNPSWRRTSAPLLPPPSKKQRVEATSSSRYEYAGAHDEALFPDGKTTLNNVLQVSPRMSSHRPPHFLTVLPPSLASSFDRDTRRAPDSSAPTRGEAGVCHHFCPHPRALSPHLSGQRHGALSEAVCGLRGGREQEGGGETKQFSCLRQALRE